MKFATSLLSAVVALGTPWLLACGSSQHCVGPSRGVTPGRQVAAPPVKLAGMRLDAKQAEVQAACTAMHGDFRAPAFCRPPGNALQLMSEGPWQLLGVDLHFDVYGSVKQIQAVYLIGETGTEQQMANVLAQISAVIGEPRGGDLSWCGKVPNCKLSSYAEWGFEGGQVRLQSRQDAQSLELTLSHEHEDMNERVVYGLPYCGG